MKESLSDYRDTVAKVLAGRSMAGIATSNGLPRDAIRYVMQGHDPKLSRADAICRALDFSYTIGTSSDVKSTFGVSLDSSDNDSVLNVSMSDTQITLLLDRLADLWQVIDTRERKHLALVIANLLELTDMRHSITSGKVVKSSS